ncbi:MAG: PIG-L family deacetylase [Bacteroidetes Order II. Incertae sedis bacterium]|nr:PIG-L family deacetylase [Bacteroidetes Order II. bacterium]
MNILVIAAHPDDEVLGCGGTIARHIANGHTVHVCILGEGATSRFDRREEAPRQLVDFLATASQKAANLLGVRSVQALQLPDQRFDTLPFLDMVKLLTSVIEEKKPEVVYTQHGGDLNLDHTITFRATLTACRPLQGCPVRALYAYEVPSSTEYAFGKFSPIFQPDTFVDISTFLAGKIAAMQCYAPEMRPFPHPRSEEVLRSIATRWGSQVGLVAAEAFQTIFRICS